MKTLEEERSCKEAWIETAPLLAHSLIKSIWPPADPVVWKPQIVFVNVAGCPELPARLGLSNNELVIFAEQPGEQYVALGELEVVRDSHAEHGYTYRPAPAYRAEEAARWTRMYAKTKPSLIQSLAKATVEARKEAERLAAEAYRRKQAEQAAVEKSQREANPQHKVKLLEQRVRQLEDERAKEAAERVAVLEAQLKALEQ